MKKISDKELEKVQGGAMNSITTINTDTCEYATYDALSETHPVTMELTDTTLTKI